MSSLSVPPVPGRAWFWAAVGAGLLLRAAGLLWPGNYDLESYSIVADLVRGGKNVYAETARYNYGPLWAGILALLKSIAGDSGFRLVIWAVLSLADIGLAWFLRRWAGTAAAVAFLLSPWSFLITGHHHQFDNTALLAGACCVHYVITRPEYRTGGLNALTLRQTAVAAAVLGLSLVLKHVLFLFPLWMAFRVRSVPKRLLWAVLPPALFGLSLLPFWTAAGGAGIRANVFGYQSHGDAPFLNTFGPAFFDTVLGCQPHRALERLFFYGGLILTGALLRRRSLPQLMACYTAFLVLTSSGVYNQYFAIPVIFTAMHRNFWSGLYQLLALPYYIVHHDGLNYAQRVPAAWHRCTDLVETFGRHIILAALFFSVVQVFRGAQVKRMILIAFYRAREAAAGRAEADL